MYNCPKCNRETKRNHHIQCSNCCNKQRRLNAKPSICHPDRKEHARGLCRSCYKLGEKGIVPTCHPDRKHAAQGLCRECYQKLPENIERVRKVRRLKKYSLSEEEYNNLLTKQNYKCMICGNKPEAVDHDHETGEVRGLLCKLCNTGLGHFKDNTSLLQKAIVYLNGNS